MPTPDDSAPLLPEQLESLVITLRGQRVMLSPHLAPLYGVSTKALTQAVKRNPERFPADFMFQLTEEEAADLRSQFVTSNNRDENASDNLKSQTVTANGDLLEDTAPLRSQTVMSNENAPTTADKLLSQFVTANPNMVRFTPYAFTEQGVAMLSSVLRSPRAVAVNIEIMRAFVRLRHLLAGNAELTRRMEELEASVQAGSAKTDQQFRAVFNAIRQLMTPPASSTGRIGFRREGVDE